MRMHRQNRQDRLASMFKARVWICSAILILTAQAIACAQGARSVRLDELLSEALKGNPGIAAARNGVLAAKALQPQAWGLDNPMLRLENDNAHGNPFDSQHAEQNRIGFSQTLPFPAKLFGRSLVAAKELAAAQAKCDQTINDVMRDVKKAYSNLTLAIRTKELLEESRQALDSFRDIANRKYSIGKASQADVLGAEVEMGKILNEVTTQEALVITAQATLKALLNTPGQEDFSVPETLEVKPVDMPLEDLVKKSQELNPALRVVEAEVEKAEITVGLAKLEYAPDVQVQTEFRQVDGGPDVWDGFLGVSIPLWAWKQQGQIAQAKSFMDQKRNSLSTQKNETILAVREAYAGVQSAWHIVNNLKTVIIPQAEQTVNVSETAYENDKIDFLSLMSYWRILLNYRIDLQRAIAQYTIAMADLERAVGSVVSK